MAMAWASTLRVSHVRHGHVQEDQRQHDDAYRCSDEPQGERRSDHTGDVRTRPGNFAQADNTEAEVRKRAAEHRPRRRCAIDAKQLRAEVTRNEGGESQADERADHASAHREGHVGR